MLFSYKVFASLRGAGILEEEGNTRFMRYLVSVLLVVVVLQVGCMPGPSQSASNPVRQFQVLGRYYGSYLSDNRGLPPSSDVDFKNFLNANRSEIQSRGYGDLDQFLVSPRDGKDIVVLYGSDVIEDGPGGLPWVAYEQTGVNGSRFAIGARGVASELGPEEFSSVFGEGE